ncbi:MAG: porin [Rhodospirillaceae bacterium]
MNVYTRMKAHNQFSQKLRILASTAFGLTSLFLGANSTWAAETAAQQLDLKPLPHITSADGSSSFEVVGFLQADAVANDLNALDDGAVLRRVRLGVKGKIDSDWTYDIKLDAGRGMTELYDASIGYRFRSKSSAQVGQFKEPIGLEWSTGAPWWTFLDRGLVSTLTPKRAVGAMLSSGGQNWGLSGGWFGDAARMKGTSAIDRAITGRFHVVPMKTEDIVLHIGLGASFRTPDDVEGIRYKTKHETSLSAIPILDTGRIEAAKRSSVVNLEALLNYRSVSLQMEYAKTRVLRSEALPNAHFDAFYVQGSWFMTGENRPYNASKGGMARVKPLEPLSKHSNGGGALEIAFRYDFADLTDSNILGGEMDRYTLGLNWYLNGNTRISANYITAYIDRPMSYLDGTINALAGRFQIAF